jgi:TonB family protein
MFEVLVESGAQPAQAIGSRLTSVLVHAGLVALAAVGVRSVAPAQPIKPVAVPIDIYVAPRQTATPRADGGGGVPGTIFGPPPAVPIDASTVIPPVTVPLAAVSAAPTAKEVARRQLRTGEGTAGPDLDAPVLLAGEVDEPVAVLVPARLIYPPRMAAAGITGEVRVEFVVDTGGRCEPGSIRVISSTDPAFEASARAAICDANYRPAHVRGEAVRQLVHQKVAFRQR